MVSLHTTWCLRLISFIAFLQQPTTTCVRPDTDDLTDKDTDDLTDKYTDDLTFNTSRNIGKGSSGEVFPVTRKDDPRQLVVKKAEFIKFLQRKQINNEIEWGVR